jgi:NAD(P)-dependent dehydrogenase (short-subunit alcohol dehydrogenase family)
MPLPVAVITGAANGIGLETARRLARTHRVALLDIDGEAAEKAAAEVNSTAAAFRCDITDPASVAAAVAGVIDRFGAIDVAVSNAGIGTIGAARHLDPDVLAAQLNVNVTGNWRFIHACLPHLVESRGYLLGVASAAAIFCPPGESMYAASKAGLEALLDVVRVEVAHLGVDVGVAYLMFINTPMVRDGDREHADFARMRAMLRGPAGKTYAASIAADALVRGIERRSRQVFVPGTLKYQHLLRGVIKPVVDREFRRIAPEVDRLTEEKVRERGSFAAAFNRGALAAHERRAADGGTHEVL